MATRYINTSEKTKIIAEGIALFAAFQNLPMTQQKAGPIVMAWNDWTATYPDWIEFVEAEQFALFDRVNAL